MTDEAEQNKETTTAAARFTLPSRLLHWTMAPMVIAQLLIGVTMIAALSYYPLLLAIHRPLGVAILAFAVVRLANRLTHRPPPFLATMSRAERRIATWSEYLLYALLLVQPLTGWAMLSAARFPITLWGPVRLPGIAPHDIDIYAVLAAVPQRLRIPAIRDVYRPYVRGTLSHARSARPAHRSHGGVAQQTCVPRTGRKRGLTTACPRCGGPNMIDTIRA